MRLKAFIAAMLALACGAAQTQTFTDCKRLASGGYMCAGSDGRFTDCMRLSSGNYSCIGSDGQFTDIRRDSRGNVSIDSWGPPRSEWGGGSALGGLGRALEEIAAEAMEREAARERLLLEHELEMRRIRESHDFEMRRIDAQRRRDAEVTRAMMAEAERAAAEAKRDAELAALRREVERQQILIEWAKVERVHPDARKLITDPKFRSWVDRQEGRTAELLASERGEDLAAAITEYKRSIKSKAKAAAK